MNKKPIDTTAIENELEGASHFFPTTENAKKRTKPSGVIQEEGHRQETQGVQKAADRNERRPQESLSQEPIKVNLPSQGADAKPVQPPQPANTVTPSNHDTVVSRHHDATTPAMVESIRKAVKLVGKEAATHRFTPEEKQAIADIIYTYRRQGYDTSENEIARIAINWLVWEHQENNEESILTHVLKALKE